ncbi:MAG: hypothetical protein EZS28_049098, partial [Streblomastix strix]
MSGESGDISDQSLRMSATARGLAASAEIRAAAEQQILKLQTELDIVHRQKNEIETKYREETRILEAQIKDEQEK